MHACTCVALTGRLSQPCHAGDRERRGEVESAHGDAFTLLAIFDDWIRVKAARRESTRCAFPPSTLSCLHVLARPQHT